MILTYYAVAENAKGKLEQLRIIRENGAPISQQCTGKTYRTLDEAITDLTKLNCPQSGRKASK